MSKSVIINYAVVTDECSFILHILSYHDSSLVRLIIGGICILYVYFVVTSIDFLVVVRFLFSWV